MSGGLLYNKDIELIRHYFLRLSKGTLVAFVSTFAFAICPDKHLRHMHCINNMYYIFISSEWLSVFVCSNKVIFSLMKLINIKSKGPTVLKDNISAFLMRKIRKIPDKCIIEIITVVTSLERKDV